MIGLGEQNSFYMFRTIHIRDRMDGPKKVPNRSNKETVHVFLSIFLKNYNVIYLCWEWSISLINWKKNG